MNNKGRIIKSQCSGKGIFHSPKEQEDIRRMKIKELIKRAEENGMVKDLKEAWNVLDSSVDTTEYLKGKTL